MTVFFLAVIGAIAITALLVYDMDRKRRRMREVLARLEPLAEGSKKFRAQYLRGISRSIFFNNQLMDAMDREIGVMEEEREIPSPEESGKRSLFSAKRLKALEARLETLEMFKLAQQSGEEAGGDQPSPPPDPADGEVDDGSSQPPEGGAASQAAPPA